MLEADGGAAGDPIKASQAAGGTVNSASTSTGYSTGVWTHAAAVFATTTSRTAYINGGSSGTSTSTRNNPSGLDSVSIGRLGYSTPINYLNGRTAEVGVWNVELTATEIATLAKGVSPLLVRADALVSYWPIVGRTSPEIDLMGAHPLTLTGTVQVDHPPMRYPGRVHVVPAASGPAQGSGTGTAATAGDGEGYALHYGNGAASAASGGAGTGYDLHYGSGEGTAASGGAGEGEAPATGAAAEGSGVGTAATGGAGEGYALHSGSGAGTATTGGYGDGFALSEAGGNAEASGGLDMWTEADEMDEVLSLLVSVQAIQRVAFHAFR